MERSYDDRQKTQHDRSRQPDQASHAGDQQRGGAQGSAADLEKRGRAGLPETGHDNYRRPADRSKSEF